MRRSVAVNMCINCSFFTLILLYWRCTIECCDVWQHLSDRVEIAGSWSQEKRAFHEQTLDFLVCKTRSISACRDESVDVDRRCGCRCHPSQVEIGVQVTSAHCSSHDDNAATHTHTHTHTHIHTESVMPLAMALHSVHVNESVMLHWSWNHNWHSWL